MIMLHSIAGPEWVHIFSPPIIILFCLSSSYIGYYYLFHPLAKYPGPFLASFSNLWKLYHLWSLHLPERLVELHETYGPIVRVGPNDLSFQSGDAVAPIYKAGRALKKTKFYDGFTTFNPNLFGTQNEEIHALRRRQLAHAFSFTSMKDMEMFVDIHLQKLLDNLDHCCKTGEVFDLKQFIAFYVLDVLGELAFSRSFDSQIHMDPDRLPPINDHIYLACLMGMMPSMMPIFKAVAPWMPVPWFRALIRARKQLKDLTANCVAQRMLKGTDKRKDLLTNLINSVDPETGEKLTELEINTEAFAMIVAGSHTTSGTLTLLFAHLLQNPRIMALIVNELDRELQDVQTEIIPIEGLEARLPYTMACINENFRINPVFTMPLPRQVMAPEGAVIDGHIIPRHNHVVHHNASIWGPDHNVFKPERFLGPESEHYKRYLTPFSIGHRMCIGRNLAMMNILKVTTTLLRRYEIVMEDPKEKIVSVSVGISEKEGPLMCRVRKRG